MMARWRTRLGSLPSDPEMDRLFDLGLLAVAGLLSFIVFARVPVHALSPDFHSEFKHHALLLKTLESKGTPPYSLWYVIQRVLVGRNFRDELLLLNAAWLMLGALAFLKGIVLTGVLLATSASRLSALVVGFLLGTAVAFPMPWLTRESQVTDGPINYLGTLPPNVFMSATQLVANIAAVVAVVTLTLWFQKPTVVRFASMVLMALVATLAKPGIAPALIATVALLSVLLVRDRRVSLRTAVVQFAITSVLVGLPLLAAYKGFMAGTGLNGLHSVLMPFDVWTTFTSQWFPDLIASWAFPIVVIGALWVARSDSVTRPVWLLPAWSVAVVATLMFALLGEVDGAGKVVYAGNFAWGAIAATSGLYAVSAIALRNVPWRVRWVPITVLVVQAVAGLVYINEYIKTGNFV